MSSRHHARRMNRQDDQQQTRHPAAVEPLEPRLLLSAVPPVTPLVPAGQPEIAAIVTIPDASLEAAIRLALNKPSEDLTDADMLLLTTLDASDSTVPVANLTGLEYATNLTDLYLSGNEIGDLTPLVGLTSLVGLDLGHNEVVDISPLNGLTALGVLDLGFNRISDVEPLDDLTNLVMLILQDNPITNITPLAALTNLGSLDVRDAYLYLGPGSPAVEMIDAMEALDPQADALDDPQREPGDELDIAYDLGSFGDSDVPRFDSQEIGDGPYGAEDVDLYKFILTETGSVGIDVDAESIGSPLDAYLRLYDVSLGDWIASNDNTHGSDPFITAPSLAAGTYYVGVSGFPNDHYPLATADTDETVPSTSLGLYDLRVAKGSNAPSAPDLADASDTGQLNNDDITMLDNSSGASTLQFTVDGTIVGATVTIYADGVPIGQAVAGDTTTVVTTNGMDILADGVRSITARQKEPTEVQSIDSGALEITVDTTAPTADMPDLAPGSDTGQSNSDNITQGNTPQFTGTANDGAGSGIWKVDVDSDDGKSNTAVTASFYDVTLPTLDEGDWTVTATAYDVAGNFHTTDPLAVTVDRTGPTVSVPDLAPASDTGQFDDDDITRGIAPHFTGTVTDPNGIWGVHIIPDDGDKVVLFTAGPVYDGTLDTLNEGDRTVSARAYDVAGNTSTTGNLAVTVDRTDPTADVPDLAPGSDTGLSNSDDITQGQTPQFTGTANDDRSGIWKVDVDSDDGKSGMDDATPFYEVTLATLNEGDRTVTATAYDVAGNFHTTDPLGVTVDRSLPAASFTADPNPAACNQDISFDASASGQGHPSYTIVNWEWDFESDGTYDATGETVLHSYGQFGLYNVTLRVTDDNASPRTGTTTNPVDISLGNRAPVADANGPYQIAVGEDVQLDGSGSSDPDEGCGDSIVAYHWDLDDDGQFDDATGASPLVPWATISGLPVGVVNTVTLRVTDSFGATDTDETGLTIFDNQPVASFTADPNPAACGQEISFDASGSSHDRPDRSIVLYEWDFESDGTYDQTGVTVLHSYGQFGQYNVTLRVTDDNIPPKTDTTAHVIDVSLGNRAPVADANGPYWIDVGDDLQLDGSASTDPDEGCGDSVVAYRWDLDDDGQFDDATGATPTIPWAQISALPGGGAANPIGLEVEDTFGITNTAATTLSIYDNEPVASFTADPNPAACGQDITFDASGSSHDRPDRSIVLYEWDFESDGTYDQTGVTVLHSYGQFGQYNVTLRVTDDNIPPKTDTTAHVIDVSLGNRAPVADANGPYLIAVGDGVQLDGTGSSDPDEGCGDSIVAYHWDLDDDGQFDDAAGASPNVSWATIEGLGLAYPSDPVTGLPINTIRLRVTDSFGATDTDWTTLEIRQLGAPDLLDGSDTGASPIDNLTNLDNDAGRTLDFEVRGTIDGATVTIHDTDGTEIGSAVASGPITVVTTNGTHDLVDGDHTITARQTQPSEPESGDSDPLDIIVDTTAPGVDGFGISSTNGIWTIGTVDSLLWMTGRSNQSAPWSLIDQVVVRFDEAVTAGVVDLTLTGPRSGQLNATAVSGGGSEEVTWTVPGTGDFGNLDTDRYIVAATAGVSDVAGNALAGGWSGDLTVFVGDVDGNRTAIDIFDRAMVRLAYGRDAGEDGYSIFADLIGNGGVSIFDRAAVRRAYGDELPAPLGPTASSLPVVGLIGAAGPDSGDLGPEPQGDLLPQATPSAEAEPISILAVSPAAEGRSQEAARLQTPPTTGASAAPDAAMLTPELTTGLTDPLTGQDM